MKIHGPLVEGRFKKRLNRFEAIVDIQGTDELVHVPNTGRLRELLVEDATVLVKKYDNPKRKTSFGLLLVQKDGLWISIDSANVPNRIVWEALNEKGFEQFQWLTGFNREVTVGRSRFDFAVYSPGYTYFIEVKGVTLVRDNCACFPDAPTERGKKHLEELIVQKNEGNGAGVIFIIQRNDALELKPNDVTDPEFGALLRKARTEGVDAWAYLCEVTPENITLSREIPVIL